MTQLLLEKPPVGRADTTTFGFVVLCPDDHPQGVRNTVASIRQTYPEAAVLCVVGNGAGPERVAATTGIAETVVGGGSITSLINVGVKKSRRPWNVLVFAGSWVGGDIQRKFDLFVRAETDILFPVVGGRANFVEGCLNGVIMHKRALADVGDFPADPLLKDGCNELELVKLFWAIDAIARGFTFKAIIGMRVV